MQDGLLFGIIFLGNMRAYFRRIRRKIRDIKVRSCRIQLQRMDPHGTWRQCYARTAGEELRNVIQEEAAGYVWRRMAEEQVEEDV